MGGGHRLLDLVVADDAPLRGIHQEHAPRLQARFVRAHSPAGGIAEHADFGRHHHHVIFGHIVARRAQTVAVEHRADDRAVGEADRGRAVPRLHQRAWYS
jgi:hypothetical protein